MTSDPLQSIKQVTLPDAVNIPLFNDDERVAVGTKYKKEGRIPAIIEGLKQTGPVMFLKLEEALRIADDNKLLVHCWRGGMRSEAMAWLFSLGGIETISWKEDISHTGIIFLKNFTEKRRMIVLGGMTGSSKTHIPVS